MNSTSCPLCPHCRHRMRKWRVPEGSTWPNEYFCVCFNDRCPYFTNGWQHLWETQRTRASYRCRLDPHTGRYLPLPVWSREALRDRILE